MESEKLRILIEALRREIIASNNSKSDSALALLGKLESELGLAAPDYNPIENSIGDSALEMETLFAAKHPTSERILREIIDALNKMGI